MVQRARFNATLERAGMGSDPLWKSEYGRNSRGPKIAKLTGEKLDISGGISLPEIASISGKNSKPQIKLARLISYTNGEH